MATDKTHRRTFLRVALLLTGAVLIFLALNTLLSFAGTLKELDRVEAERDGWQRPADVIQALGLQAGNTVADFGSGAGYFALKLGPIVGKQGSVLAVDLRPLSLFFLSTRALLRGERNLYVIRSQANEPHLPQGTVDAILVCNTYHELSDPGRIVGQLVRALRPGGRLVVVDRAPQKNEVGHTHEVAVATVENELRQSGLQIVSKMEHFIDQPSGESWWLLIVLKPNSLARTPDGHDQQ